MYGSTCGKQRDACTYSHDCCHGHVCSDGKCHRSDEPTHPLHHPCSSDAQCISQACERMPTELARRSGISHGPRVCVPRISEERRHLPPVASGDAFEGRACRFVAVHAASALNAGPAVTDGD